LYDYNSKLLGLIIFLLKDSWQTGYYLQIMPEVKCPNCGKMSEWNGNEFRPFCSERCKLIDFGAWADGNYALPSENAALTEEDLREIEKALEEKERAE